MTIANYSELEEEIVSLCHREGDSAFEAKIPLFVKLAEARFNRRLRTRDMEETMSSTALTDGAASLPSGFRAFKELRYVDGNTSYTLQPKSLEWIRAQNTNTGDPPRFFAVAGSQVVCWPENGSIRGTYYEEIPGLEANSTNWLLTKHPDLYLFGALTEAAIWSEDDSRLAVWADRAAALLDDINRTDDRDSFDGGILAVRAR